jgi:hypothetical protein
MNDAANTDTLTVRLDGLRNPFYRTAFSANGAAYVAISRPSSRSAWHRHPIKGEGDRFSDPEVYAAQTDDAPEMFIGYASACAEIGCAAFRAMHDALYRDGFLPEFV